MLHVIIGSGAAGMAAARTIREIDPQASITVISEDGAVYSRCMLHQYIDGERSGEALTFVESDFFEKYGVSRIMGQKVTAVDTSNKIVKYGDGEGISYDRLLIATGSNSLVPPIGVMREAKNVYSLRNFTDAVAIKEKAADAEKVIIIGAGLIGLDAAYPLVRAGKKVSIVELADRALSQNLDLRASMSYQKKFEEAGCTFHFGKKAVDTDFACGRVTGLVLDDGERLDCDMLIAAVGVSPAVEFLEGSGINISGAVVVDSFLETNVKGVFAAGDVAGLSAIWPNASYQGRTAAKNMCGVRQEYTDAFTAKNTVNFFNLATLSLGKISPADGDREEIFEARNVYKKAVITGNLVTGVIIQGDISGSGHWLHMIKNEIPLKDSRPVFKTSFADYYGIDSDGNYAWS